MVDATIQEAKTQEAKIVNIPEEFSLTNTERLEAYNLHLKRELVEKDKKGAELQRILTENIKRQAEMSNSPRLWLHTANKDRKPPAPNRKQF